MKIHHYMTSNKRMSATTFEPFRTWKVALLLALLLSTCCGRSQPMRSTQYLPMKKKPSLTGPETLKFLKEIYNGVDIVPQKQSSASPTPPTHKQVPKTQTHTKYIDHQPSNYNSISGLQNMDANVVIEAFYPDYYY